MTERTHAEVVTHYTTLGLGVLGLDWATARRIATEIADDKFERPRLSDRVTILGESEAWFANRTDHIDC